MTRARYLMDDMHPLMQLLILITLSLIGYFTLALLGMFLVKPLFGITMIDVVLENVATHRELVAQNPRQVNALKFLQFLSSVGGFLLPGLFFAWLKFPNGDYLKLKTHIHTGLLLMAIIILIVSMPFIGFSYEINKLLDLPSSLDSIEKLINDSENITEQFTLLFLRMPTSLDLIINIIVMAFIPAIGEELLFRGSLQQVLKEWFKNVHIAIWVAAFVFSFIHFQFYGFLPRFLLGALLGYLFVWSGSLWVPIIAHAINNGAQVIMVYLYEHGYTNIDINSEQAIPYYATLISITATMLLLFMYKRISESHKFIY